MKDKVNISQKEKDSTENQTLQQKLKQRNNYLGNFLLKQTLTI